LSDQGGSRPSLSDLKIDPESRTHDRGARRTLVIAAVGLAVIAVAVIVIATRSAPTEVTIASARPAPAAGSQTVLNASGYVTPRRRATVAAKITGRVTEVLVDEGMVVEQGQVLARLDDSDARRRYEAIRAERDVALAAIDELEVNLADARRTLARTLDLHADGVASQQDLDSATAAADALEARAMVARRSLDSAEAQLAVAAQDLENYVIRAPFGGIAVSKDAQPGEMVSPVSAGGGFTRTGISTIVDMQSLEIEVDVNESYIARVSPGQPADAILDAYPEWHIPATVRTIIPTADRQKATVKVRLTFDRLDPKILPDMGIKVAFLELAQKEDGPRPQAQSMIPTSALRRDGSQVVVFIVNDEVVERRAVKLGRELGTEVEVVAGVAPGERLVVQNLDSLSDGQRVRVAG
jgi:RND family efflux transporter MFP subunit